MEQSQTSDLHSDIHPTQTQVNHIFLTIHGRPTNNGDGKHVHFQQPRASLLSYDRLRKAQCPYCQPRYGSQEGFPFHKW